MLENSFIHLPGIGEKTEWLLWRAGLTCWDSLAACPADAFGPLNLKPGRRELLHGLLEESRQRLADADARYFADRLPNRELWRLFGRFAPQAAYLDIETNGYDRITAVVLHREGQTFFFVRDQNLHELPLHLAGLKLLVTYNGRNFDWPVLQANFARLPAPAAHLDLRYPFYRLRFRGGLKAVEKGVGLKRPDELEGIDGWSAVWLWRRHQAGEERAMPALLRYCAEDVLNLKFLAEWGYNALAGPLPVGAQLFPRPAVAACDRLPAADRDLMDHCRRALAPASGGA